MHTGSEKRFTHSLDGADIIAQARQGTARRRVLVSLLSTLKIQRRRAAGVPFGDYRPDRELVMQIAADAESLTNYRFTRMAVVGGIDYEKQKNNSHSSGYRCSNTRSAYLILSVGCSETESVEMLVIDETDRMLNGLYP